ncbi:uncharacterized protein LOC132336864 isoform X2 [Haemorhous mexicanus]|uniref:uncharacterized protein LOC132336864 isoform X2 n=1 Tax=Haemorhous mexicanus TaxID=30427 RepID=UPI0028BE60A8|nr:uncharacterized protein LOC132336864 isoform X2 [Haemorhous mexicanus]XP_059720763.1 uncharacterized protein LOC132336864 isoform X2 [Haemorhous mexicanus]
MQVLPMQSMEFIYLYRSIGVCVTVLRLCTSASLLSVQLHVHLCVCEVVRFPPPVGPGCSAPLLGRGPFPVPGSWFPSSRRRGITWPWGTTSPWPGRSRCSAPLKEGCCGCGRAVAPARTPRRTSCPSASCWRASCARGSDGSDPACPGGRWQRPRARCEGSRTPFLPQNRPGASAGGITGTGWSSSPRGPAAGVQYLRDRPVPSTGDGAQAVAVLQRLKGQPLTFRLLQWQWHDGTVFEPLLPYLKALKEKEPHFQLQHSPRHRGGFI